MTAAIKTSGTTGGWLTAEKIPSLADARNVRKLPVPQELHTTLASKRCCFSQAKFSTGVSSSVII
ncbi:hypothetical protein [Kamptonema formosum]|uniref:hypothetical protein n=1 Tax=Kamptonema formosum TaxID=331992 RepID=UPI0018E278E9|nr:hypothetical protein [Oscillatoria sp. PCC 10802]